MLVDGKMLLHGKLTEITKFLPIAAGKCSKRPLDSCWALLKGCRKAAENAQMLLDSLWAILKTVLESR
jgi:hypothetical protein